MLIARGHVLGAQLTCALNKTPRHNVIMQRIGYTSPALCQSKNGLDILREAVLTSSLELFPNGCNLNVFYDAD